MTNVVVKIRVKPTSRSVPLPTFTGVPGGSLPGQFLGHGPTWQYPDAAGTNITKVAQGALGGHRVVYSSSVTQVAYANQSDYLQSIKIVGITTGAAADGSAVVIQPSGVMVEPGWNWSAGDIWLGSNGQLTQVQPTSGCLVRVGVALAPTAMQINIEFLVNLN